MKARFAFAVQALFLLGGLLAGPERLGAQPIVPGEGDWRTLDTEHFHIHFRREYRPYALRMGKIAERVHARLEKKYRSGIRKTHLTLSFKTDTVNAFANVVGYERVVLYMDSPRAGEFARYDLWMEMVFIHEYAHILSLRYDQGRLYWLTRLLTGLPVNVLSPSAAVEGIAVYEESKEGLGRVDDPLTRMVFRTTILDKAFPGPGEMMTASHRWPFNRVWYLFGGRFMSYLGARFGEESLMRFWRTDNFPVFLDSRFRAAMGADYARLYEDFKKAETELFEKEAARVREQGLTRFRRLTFDGYSKSFLQPGENGRLLYFARPRDEQGGVYSIAANAVNSSERPRPESVRQSNATGGFTQGGGLKFYSEDYLYSPSAFGLRLELFDGDDGFFLRRLLPGKSATYPSLRADGRMLYYIERDGFERRLVEQPIDKSTRSFRGKRRVLLRAPLTGIMQYTALAPDGDRIALLLRLGEKGRGALVVCSPLNSGPSPACRTLVKGEGAMAQPRFSSDGRTLYFSSDADGIYNLYAADTATGAVRRLTRNLTGYFYPAPAGDHLFALKYFLRGYDLVAIRNQDLLNEPANFFTTGNGEIEKSPGGRPASANAPGFPETKPEPGWRERDYAGVPAMRPYFSGLLPILTGPSFINLGVIFEDPLGRHTAIAAAGPGAPSPNTLSSLSYAYNRYNFAFAAAYFGNFSRSSNDRNFFCHFERLVNAVLLCGRQEIQTQQSAANVQYLHAGRNWQQRIALGWSHTKLRNANRSTTVRFANRDMNLSGPTISYLADSTQSFPQSISPEQGIRLALSGEMYEPGGSWAQNTRSPRRSLDYGAVEVALGWYLPSFWSHHVNFLSAFAFGYVGKDYTEQGAPLSEYVRGLDSALSPVNHRVVVFTYEYRLPLLWWSKEVFWKELMVRQVGLSVFYDYGAAFDLKPFKEDFIGSYGIVLTLGLNLFYQPLPLGDLTFTIARGTRGPGELQFSVGVTLGLSSGAHNRLSPSPLARPMMPQPARHLRRPGWFRSRAAGGLLE